MAALELLLVVIVAAAGLAVFMERRIVRAVLYLAAAAIGTALIFLYIGQDFVALLQLLVFVGGLSTYLIVAVATEEKAEKMLSRLRFAALAVAAGVILVSALGTAGPASQSQVQFLTIAQQAITKYSALLYLYVILLFSAATASVLVMRRFSRK